MNWARLHLKPRPGRDGERRLVVAALAGVVLAALAARSPQPTTAAAAAPTQRSSSPERATVFRMSPARIDISPATPTLASAARGGDLAAIQRLLAAGVDVNGRDADGNTALMLAAAHGRPAAARLLLNAGADPEARNHRGQTALDLVLARMPMTAAGRPTCPNDCGCRGRTPPPATPVARRPRFI